MLLNKGLFGKSRNDVLRISELHRAMSRWSGHARDGRLIGGETGDLEGWEAWRLAGNAEPEQVRPVLFGQ